MKAVKTVSIVLLVFVFIFAIVFFCVDFVHDEIIYFYYYHTGNYSKEQKDAMKNTRSKKPAEYIIENNGITYKLKLPDGATEYPGGGYLVINYEFWDEYYKDIKQSEDYDFDQMGSEIILTSKDEKIRIYIGIHNVARRYELLTVSYESLK